MIENILLLTLLLPRNPATTTPKSVGATAFYSAAVQTPQNNSISGFVFNESHRPVPNLRVELLDEVDGVLAITNTNGAGQYAFNRISTGVFQIKVWATGTDYEPQTERVAIGAAMGGGRGSQSEQLDFVLHPRRVRGRATTVSGSSGAIFVQEVPENARVPYEQAVKDLDSDKNREKAMAGLLRAIELFPTYYAALDLLGQQYVMRASYSEAVDVLTRAIAVNPRSGTTWYTLGYAQYKLRLLPNAVESLAQAASLNNDSVNAHLVLGTVQRMQKQWVPAETHLKQAKTLSKTPVPEIHWQLALLYNQTGRSPEAATELELFLKAQPDSRDADKIRRLIAELRKKK